MTGTRPKHVQRASHETGDNSIVCFNRGDGGQLACCFLSSGFVFDVVMNQGMERGGRMLVNERLRAGRPGETR